MTSSPQDCHATGVSALVSQVLDKIIGATIPGERSVLGIVGPPGSGKSTLAENLAAAVSARGVPTVRIPMDGFHLADRELLRLGRHGRKGAIDTFDADSYATLLRRARFSRDQTVYAPDFDRTYEQPIAGSIPILPHHRLVITEGNYLLSPSPPWPTARELMDEVWYCDLEDKERQRRLMARHERFGKTPAAAREWVMSVDEGNAAEIKRQRHSADLVIDMNDLRLAPGRD